MQEYKSNSHLSKQKAKEIENNKNIQKVVSGTAKRKKNEARRFADIFIREDISNVKSYVFMDVLVPAIKKAISDIVTDGVDMILFGTTGRNGKKGNTISGTYKNYASFSSNNSSRDRYQPAERYNYDDIVYETRGEAEAVLNQLDAIIDKYEEATVLDLYDLSGITGDYTDNKFGWENLSRAEVMRVRGGGYTIRLPRPIALNRK